MFAVLNMHLILLYTGEKDPYSVFIGTVEYISEYQGCRLSAADGSECALEADIARLSNMQEQREASIQAEERAPLGANGPSAEVIQLQCVVEAKDRDLAAMQQRIAALQVCFWNWQ